MTYDEALKSGINYLEKHEVPNAHFDAEELLLYVSEFSKADYLLHRMEEMPGEKENGYLVFLEERGKRIPLQHIIGVQDFMGLEFKVNRDVLCPRLDTESVVERALELASHYEAPEILDLCTGSGCIAISMYHFLKSEKKKVRVDAVDLSEKALEVAKKNAFSNRAYIEFYQGDLFEPLPTDKKYDMIVSNPPYIPSRVIDGLMPEVRDHEPRTALDGDEDGLKFYRLISEQARNYLAPGGCLVYEIGFNQGEDVSEIMNSLGYKNVSVEKDLAQNDRIAFGFL
jgi:release factor glutamine methyltransferase